MWELIIWESLRFLLFWQIGFKSAVSSKVTGRTHRQGTEHMGTGQQWQSVGNAAQIHFRIDQTLSNGLREHLWSRSLAQVTFCSAWFPPRCLELGFTVLTGVCSTVVMQGWRYLSPYRNTYNLKSSCAHQPQLLEILSVWITILWVLGEVIQGRGLLNLGVLNLKGSLKFSP